VSARLVARAGMYAALYAALTLAPGLSGLAYGQVQFRVSEGLLAFAAADVAAVPGLALGTALANIGSPLGPVDVFYGAALTLTAALGMWWVGPKLWALALPVIVNGLGVPVELALVLDFPYWLSVGFVVLGEAVVMGTFGVALLMVARRYGTVLGLQPRRRPRLPG
jgi:uncharacterized membrane protein